MPAIKPGRVIIFSRFGQPQPGKLVLARVEDREVIKFITQKKAGLYSLDGVLDGSASYLIDRTAIVGVGVGYNNAYESTRRPAG